MTIEEAARQILEGGVVAFPTETVYGLGADAWNPSAIKKIFDIKGRPGDNPLIIHLSDRLQAADFASRIPDAAEILIQKCWPGPLTLVLSKRSAVLDAVTAGLSTVALRIPDHPVALELIRLTGPLAAPSANRSGWPSPTKAEHVRRDLGSGFPLLEGGATEIGLESTVLDVSRSPFTVLRPGKFTFRQLEEICGVEVVADSVKKDRPKSPGMKYTHYKPAARVQWLSESSTHTYSDINKKNSLLITHTLQPEGFIHHIHVAGDFENLAHRLYDLFRSADFQGLTDIFIEPLPPPHAHPLISALQNRIDKAAG